MFRPPVARNRARSSLLYLCYLGITEPLVQTQVIPYLAGLASAGYRVVLLTFEPLPLSGGGHRSQRAVLQRHSIEWRSLRYHKRPALPATLADIVTGIVYAAYVIRKRGVGIVHARGHVPAAMAMILRWVLGTRFVFDVRGLIADEYADAGLWKTNGILYRLTKRIEAMFFAHADAIVVLTRRAREWLMQSGQLRGRRLSIQTIPCCVDLQRFCVDPERVKRLRTSLNLDDRPVMVYAGKLGGTYMTREMVDFFAAATRRLPRLRFLVLTQSDVSLVEKVFAASSIDRDAYRCLRASPEHLPAYLALADFAISFRTPRFSQIAASPTKMAEYLAAGLPVVFNAGIGDLDELDSEQVGVRIRTFAQRDYARAAERMRVLLEGRDAAASRCRAVARKYFSLTAVGIPRYLRLYSALMDLPTRGEGLSHASYAAPAGRPVDRRPDFRVRDEA